MRMTMHSREGLFKKGLKGYCQEKLTRSIEKHRLDGEATRLDVDGHTVGDNVEIRVRLALPKQAPLTASAHHQDAHAAVDLVADKLDRQIRDLTDRQSSNHVGIQDLVSEEIGAEDFFTEDEEDTLREMGALDAVIEA
jgi:ribosomal subunit interface protein